MKIEQYVMAYEVEQDKLRSVLPDGFTSLRPVLRINAEIRDRTSTYIEFNTAVEKDGIKGWLNIGNWNDIPFQINDKTTIFSNDFLEISFKHVGIEGSCPAEKDNNGCFFIDNTIKLRMPEIITSKKEFCDCSLKWKFTQMMHTGEALAKLYLHLQLKSRIFILK